MYPQSRSNVVHRVEARGQSVAYIKQRGMASLLDGDDAVANERRVLTLLGRLGCAPRLLPVEDPGAVWVMAADGVPISALSDNPSHLHAACRAVAGALVELHQHRTGGPGDDPERAAPTAPAPWALSPDVLPASMQGSPVGSACGAVLAAAAEPRVRRALDLAASQWRPRTWTHGDLSAGNVIVAAEAEAEAGVGTKRYRAILVDFEGAGIGDPDWDLVTVVATVQNLGSDPATGQSAANELLTEYWRAGGPGRLSDALFVVRVLQTAWQLAAMSSSSAVRPEGHPSSGAPGAVDVQVGELLDIVRGHAASALRSQGVPEGGDR